MIPTPTGKFPCILLSDGEFEVWACSPARFRLLWRNRLAITSKSIAAISAYMVHEFLYQFPEQ